MKTITVNLTVTSIPSAVSETEQEVPCPRVNFWRTAVQTTEFITTPGVYTETQTIEDTDIFGVDVFTWNNYIVDITDLEPSKDVITTIQQAELSLDQTKTSIQFASEGVYNITVKVTEII